jgi:hypothetical protein
MATTKRTKKKPRNRRAAEFWRWFRSGPARWKDPVREALDNQRMLEIIDAFEARFPEAKHPSYPAGILLEFGEGPRGVCRIVFSLVFNRDDQSRRELAPLIDQIVDAAPKLARWRFQAFADAVSWHDAYLPRLALPGDVIKIDGLSFVVLRSRSLCVCMRHRIQKTRRARFGSGWNESSRRGWASDGSSNVFPRSRLRTPPVLPATRGRYASFRSAEPI